MTKICQLCGKQFETIKHGEKRKFCFECSPQGISATTTLRRKAKEIAVSHLGGKCKKCGNDKIYLLDFHHKNPNEKDGELSDFAKSYNLNDFFIEVNKCDLLCANCHREYHWLYNTQKLDYQAWLSS